MNEVYSVFTTVLNMMDSGAVIGEGSTLRDAAQVLRYAKNKYS